MARVIILLLDSFGIGASADASHLDKGANTFAHIANACAKGQADNDKRQGKLHVPHLAALGLVHATLASHPACVIELSEPEPNTPTGLYGYAKEISLGKDTPSGHWEIAGVPVLSSWGYFPMTIPCFPEKLTHDLIKQGNIPGILGNKHASGTEIIDELGEAHIQSGKPIIYTSADSVLQIAAHETYFGLEKLYELCKIARKLVDEYQIGRVIARPFAGEVGKFYRTSNRKDYATPPPSPTLLDKLCESGGEVWAIGKTADIFAHQGITYEIKAAGNDELFAKTLTAVQDAPEQSLIFTNFVDFDMLYGHRRDIKGYANALEAFDRELPKLQAMLRKDDLVIITADHGCDPTWEGTDHTREHIPALLFGPSIAPGFIGERSSFADLGQSAATWLGLAPLANGKTVI